MSMLECKEVYDRSDKPNLAWSACYSSEKYKNKYRVNKLKTKEIIDKCESATAVKLTEEVFKLVKE